MPRGYLKRVSGIGKRSRGGSSRPHAKQMKKHSTHALVREQDSLALDGFSVDSGATGKKQQWCKSHKGAKGVKTDWQRQARDVDHRYAHAGCDDNSTSRPRPPATTRDHAVLGMVPLTGGCTICLEDCTLVRLTKSCQHDHACRACLREQYVQQAQTDISNYPLRCFYPGCSTHIRAANLERHDVFRSPQELVRHHRLTALNKALVTPGQHAAHCPACDHPACASAGATTAKCKNCTHIFSVVLATAAKGPSSRRYDRDLFELSTSLALLAKTATHHTDATQRLAAAGKLGELRKQAKSIFRGLKDDAAEFHRFFLSDRATTSALAAVTMLPSDGIGRNFGWARCPHCKMVRPISNYLTSVVRPMFCMVLIPQVPYPNKGRTSRWYGESQILASPQT